jgi:hypothetical protein
MAFLPEKACSISAAPPSRGLTDIRRFGFGGIRTLFYSSDYVGKPATPRKILRSYYVKVVARPGLMRTRRCGGLTAASRQSLARERLRQNRRRWILGRVNIFVSKIQAWSLLN